MFYLHITVLEIGLYVLTMKRKLFIQLLVSVFCFHVVATGNVRIPDIRGLSLGGNGVTQNSFFNPGLLPFISKKSIGFQYHNRYQLKELGTVTGNFLFPNNFLPVAFHVSSFGYDEYRESMFRLSVGKALHERWNLGVGIHYTILQTALINERQARLSADLGISFLFVENLLIGMLIMNTPSVRLGSETADTNIFTGYLLKIGLSWEIVNNMLIAADMGTGRDHPVLGSVGMEYVVFDKFYLRSGLQMVPLMPSAGVGFDFMSFSLDIAATWHSVLGVSSGIGLSFSF